MGFTMSPMSTAAMNAVDRTKAGVASGTLSMTRMVGGTFGVAALGALVAGDRPPRPRAVAPAGPARRRASSSSTRSARRRRGHGAPARSRAATQQAFVDALGTGLTIAAVATALAAVVAWFLIDPVQPQHEPAPVVDASRSRRLPWSSAVHVLTDGRSKRDQGAARRATSSSGSTSLTADEDAVDTLGRAARACTRSRSRTRASSASGPKLDPYEHHLLLVFYSARATGDPDWPAEPLEVHVYVSGAFMVTVRREPLHGRSTTSTRRSAEEPTQRGGGHRLPRSSTR